MCRPVVLPSTMLRESSGGPVRRVSPRSKARTPFAAPARIALLFLGWLCLAWPGCAAELDRLLAAVNGKVLTLSDLELARQLNALVVFGREGGATAPAAEVDRLIDLELLRGELEIFAMEADVGDVEARLQDLRNGYAEIGGLPALLAKIGLREEELREYLRLQVALERFVQFRFRPFSDPTADEVQKYYREQLAPQLRLRGAEVPPLEAVSAKIEAVLREERANAALDKWLVDMRGQARIEYFEPVKPAPAGGQTP